MRRIVVAVLVLASTAFASDKPENWLQVRSPHFVVVTNAGDKQARTTAGQFERMRAVFHAALPKIDMDSFAPITVIAVKDEKNFKALEPEVYLAKNALKLGGLFIHGQEKNYILVRLDSGYEHPFEIVYHEYAHLLTSRAGEYMPLWLNEGIAEFYENTDIRDKDVVLGQFSEQNIYLLREQRLLPLQQLFAVDHSSPYYHEQDKGSIFYAESWALTHYLMISDFEHKTHRIADYLDLLQRKTDPNTAATQAFGDLKELEKSLDAYVRGLTFKAFKMAGATEVDDAGYKIEPLPAAQADAVRADFLAYNQRNNDARALAEQALKEDANNVQARETLGFLAVREHKIDDAKKWFAEAVSLDSQSYLAHYYYGAMALNGDVNGDEEQKVETSLRTAIKLNPQFAPAYDRLAMLLAMRRHDLQEAYMDALHAVQLEPSNVYYRMNTANVLLANNKPDNAVLVLQAAMKVAKDDGERASVQNALSVAQQFQEMQTRMKARESGEGDANVSVTSTAPVLRARMENESPSAPTPASSKEADVTLTGPKKTLTGTISGVQCGIPAVLDFKLSDGARAVAMHARNYYDIAFSALGYTPSGELHPCTDMEGMKAKVEYVEGSDKQLHVLAVELRK